MYCVTYLQSCEPDALPKWDDVRVVLDDEEDSQGFPRATVIAPTRERLLEYVREGWATDDADWFRDYVEARVEECQRRALVTLLVAVPDSYLGDASDIGAAVSEALQVSDDFGYFKDEGWKPRVLNLNAEETPPAVSGKRRSSMASQGDALFRFHTDGLTDEQVDGLTGEVLAQAEASDLHPDVSVEALDRDALAGLVRQALEKGYERSQDENVEASLDLMEEEVVRALTGEARAALVGNVVLAEGGDFWAILEERGYSVQEGQQRTPGDGDDLFFNPYLTLYDPSDPDDGELYLMYGTTEGGTVYARDCGNVHELERRLIRALGDSADWNIDDHGVAVPQERTDG